MPWPFFALMSLSGLAYIVFAFVQPPGFLQHFFRVPSLFAVFLPERHILRIGRLLSGLLIIGVTVFVYLKATGAL
jgi:hypothetical protein